MLLRQRWVGLGEQNAGVVAGLKQPWDKGACVRGQPLCSGLQLRHLKEVSREDPSILLPPATLLAVHDDVGQRVDQGLVGAHARCGDGMQPFHGDAALAVLHLRHVGGSSAEQAGKLAVTEAGLLSHPSQLSTQAALTERWVLATWHVIPSSSWDQCAKSAADEANRHPREGTSSGSTYL